MSGVVGWRVTVAFHGSCSDNLHSILHNGLQNLSGTRRERSGAIFGDGVYLADNLTVALSFAQGVWPWNSRLVAPLLHLTVTPIVCAR